VMHDELVKRGLSGVVEKSGRVLETAGLEAALVELAHPERTPSAI